MWPTFFDSCDDSFLALHQSHTQFKRLRYRRPSPSALQQSPNFVSTHLLCTLAAAGAQTQKEGPQTTRAMPPPQPARPRAQTRRRGRARPGASGSRTIVVTQTNNAHPGPSTDATATPREAPVLCLRRRRRVRWTQDTHDNEHDGKKSSKSCCIYHKPRAWDESETESEEEREGRCEERGGDSGGDGDGAPDRGDESSSSGGPVRRRGKGRKEREREEKEVEDGFFD